MIKNIPSDFLTVQNCIDNALGITCLDIHVESESREYNALNFRLNDSFITFRSAKITPTKSGQFVTLWKRIESGLIAPYDSADSIGFCIVTARTNNYSGFFIFPKSVTGGSSFTSGNINYLVKN